MKNAQCMRCLNKFYEKEIYTIQQFQYRKQPPYEWTIKYFETREVTEWDSFCEGCMTGFTKELEKKWAEDKI